MHDHHLGARNLAVGRSHYLDPAFGHQFRQRAARYRAEYLERRSLGGQQRDVHVGMRVPGPLRGHQRELVGRQRPRDRCRHDDRQAANVTALHVLDERGQDLVHVGVVNGGVLEDLMSGRAHADQERLIANLQTARRVRRLTLREP